LSADIVNLRRVRRAKARTEREKTAANNRQAFGRTKAERLRSDAERDAQRRRLDAHRRIDDEEER
jgi:hypothetical protein